MVPDKETPPNSDPAPADSVQPTTARFRILAQKCGAENSALYRIRGQHGDLVPVLDFASQDSRTTAQDRPSLPQELASLAARTTSILWWGKDTVLSNSLGRFEWAIRIEAGSALPGVGLPLIARDGAQGVAVFTGEQLCPSVENLVHIHACCNALFDELPEVMPEREESSQPAISRRELQCLKLTANGLTSEEIAQELGLSVHTANQYLANAVQKLDAANRIHAVAKALREGLID